MRSGGSFQLAGNQIHIWTWSTQAPDAVVAELGRVLTSDEAERAARFRFERVRNAFVVARGVMRCLLGRYMNTAPAEVRFVYGEKGKPALESNAGIEINLTHSHGVAAFALTTGCQLGLDIEHIRPLADMQNVAARFFCAEEAAEILALAAGERESAFFRCWTRKEAYIKAVGDGLSMPLNDFRVTTQPDAPARFVHLGHDTDAASEWTLHDLSLEPGYAAALAYRDHERPLSIDRLTDAAEILPAV